MPEWVRADAGYSQKGPELGPGVVGSWHQELAQQTGAAVSRAIRWAMNLTPADVWKNQPYVRIVLPFVARNVAQVGVHMFERVSDNDRRRVTDNPLARLLTVKPNGRSTAYELWYATQVDRMLYDRAYWVYGRRNGEPAIYRLPAVRVRDTIGDDPLDTPEAYVTVGPRGNTVEIPGNQVLEFPGYDPVDVAGIPTSPLEALKTVIAEQAAAFEFRKLTWENGGQLTGTITRPDDAAAWSPQAKERFLADVRSQFAGTGPQRGGVILLEEGMTYSAQQFNAREAGWIEAAKLSLALVASMYHVNPTMVGLLDNANYSNVRQFHTMLYQDTLGPTFAELEQRVNAFLLPRFPGTERMYVEFNIAEKLEGSFEEQAAAYQAAVGRPWMTAAEARARQNLPPLPGSDADQLVTPMNVLVGGQASPQDSAPPAIEGAASRRQLTAKAGMKADILQLKADPSEAVVQRSIDVVTAFFRRQARTLESRKDSYQTERWHRELKAAILQISLFAATAAGKATLDRLGLDPDDWDEPRTEAWLNANAEGVAAGVNATVKARVEKAWADDAELDDDAPETEQALPGVLSTLAGSYAVLTATSQSTAMSGWGTIEAVNQTGREATKTWESGSNPRSTHASLSGETVPVGELFSNGARWPGDSSLSDDERAGCNCSLAINLSTE